MYRCALALIPEVSMRPSRICFWQPYRRDGSEPRDLPHNKHTRGPAICNERVFRWCNERAFRWRKLLETGVYGTIEELAAAEKINSSYVSRILRLTLLAPDIVETILEGRQPVEMTLAALMRPLPRLWQEQVRAHLQGNTASELPFNPSGCRSIGTKARRPRCANCLRAL